MRAACTFAAAVALTGCGSASLTELPPPARPATSPPLREPPAGTVTAQRPAGVAFDATPHEVDAGRGRTARVSPARRTLTITHPDGRNETIPAGVGPTQVVSDTRNLLWVVDSTGNAVLQVQLAPRLEISRRTRVPGRPYAIALDRERIRIWVTRTADNRVTVLDGRRGAKTVGSYPSVRQPDAVAIDSSTGRAYVAGAGGTVQVIDPRHRPPS